MIATIIVPTFNQSQSLPQLVPRLCAAAQDIEIVVVDDASTDGTAEAARELARTYPVRVVERKDERGLSTAVLRGIQEARSELCVVMRADLSHPPEIVPKLIQAVQEGAQVSIGSRPVPGGGLVTRAGTLLARPLTQVRDPLAGFFCLRKSLLDGITLKPRGSKILLEILARSGATKIAELPVPLEAGDAEAGNPKDRREFLKQLWSLYLDLNAWPWRVFKFLATGTLGILPDVAVLNFVVRVLGGGPKVGAIAGAFVAMTCNYTINRIWTFRATKLPLLSSYLKYVLGALGGVGIKVGVMAALPWMPYNASNLLGILAGTISNYLVFQLWAFARR